MKNKILPTQLQGNSADSLGEFSNTSYGVFGAERVKLPRLHLTFPTYRMQCCGYKTEIVDLKYLGETLF